MNWPASQCPQQGHGTIIGHALGYVVQDASVALSYGQQRGGMCASAHAHALHALALEGLKVNFR